MADAKKYFCRVWGWSEGIRSLLLTAISWLFPGCAPERVSHWEETLVSSNRPPVDAKKSFKKTWFLYMGGDNFEGVPEDGNGNRFSPVDNHQCSQKLKKNLATGSGKSNLPDWGSLAKHIFVHKA